MSLQALYQQRQHERANQAKALDTAWEDASKAFTDAALSAHGHVTASCAPLKQNQSDVLAAAQQVQEQVQELDTLLTSWAALLNDINQAFMEMGDLEHYAAVIARKAFVVEAAIEAIVERRCARQPECQDSSPKDGGDGLDAE